MTACFAGPIINLLIALSLGFMRFLSIAHISSTPVRLEVRSGVHSSQLCIVFFMLFTHKAQVFEGRREMSCPALREPN